MPVTQLDHVAIATPDLDAGSAPYVALGLRPEGPDEDVESQGVRVRAFQVGDTLIELLMPTRLDSPIAVYLEKRGPGLHHTAYRVTDLAAEMTRLQAGGGRFNFKMIARQIMQKLDTVFKYSGCSFLLK